MTTYFKKPLNAALVVLGIVGMIYTFYLLLSNTLYASTFNDVDITTVLMISILLLKGTYTYKSYDDIKSFSLTLINALSFIFLFEALYKFLFFGWIVDSAELRELLLQVASALTILIGFSYKDYHLSKYSKILGIFFIVVMLFWVLIGYPQLFDMPKEKIHIFGIDLYGYPQVIPWDASKSAVYVINRLAKILLFGSYFFLFKEPTK